MIFMVLSRDLPLKIEEHVDQTVGIYAERRVTNRLCRDAETRRSHGLAAARACRDAETSEEREED